MSNVTIDMGVGIIGFIVLWRMGDCILKVARAIEALAVSVHSTKKP